MCVIAALPTALFYTHKFLNRMQWVCLLSSLLTHPLTGVHRSDNDESEEEEVRAGGQKKVYPSWARRAALDAQLLAQLHVDPDEIFLHNKKTCALNEVFGHAGALSTRAFIACTTACAS